MPLPLDDIKMLFFLLNETVLSLFQIAKTDGQERFNYKHPVSADLLVSASLPPKGANEQNRDLSLRHIIHAAKGQKRDLVAEYSDPQTTVRTRVKAR